MTFAARRFPDIITRRRESPGMRNSFGEWIPGASVDEELRASVQPLKLEDADLAGGSQLVDRMKVFVLPRRERISIASAATLLWNGDPVTFHGDPLQWGAGFEYMDNSALAAAFDSAGADQVLWRGQLYVVETSVTWRRYTRAVILRET